MPRAVLISFFFSLTVFVNVTTPERVFVSIRVTTRTSSRMPIRVTYYSKPPIGTAAIASTEVIHSPPSSGDQFTTWADLTPGVWYIAPHHNPSIWTNGSYHLM